jgi:membrane-bound ClpP family serine protease
MQPIVWSILLLIAGLTLIGLEIFIPSAGVISCLAALTVIASLVVAFMQSAMHGLAMLAVTAVLLPAMIGIAIRWWPHTPIGRLVLIPRPESPDDVLPDSEEYRGLRNLIGLYGVARSKMMPSGVVRIESRNYDAASEGMPVDVGERVKVIDVRVNRIVVRRVAEGEIVAEPAAAEDVMSRPLDSFGLDDPLA